MGRRWWESRVGENLFFLNPLDCSSEQPALVLGDSPRQSGDHAESPAGVSTKTNFPLRVFVVNNERGRSTVVVHVLPKPPHQTSIIREVSTAAVHLLPKQETRVRLPYLA